MWAAPPPPPAARRGGGPRSAADTFWNGDITYVWTLEGWLYLAVLLDLYSRRIVGWATSDRLTEQLALSALDQALVQRRPKPGLLHHTDRGSQYSSRAYRQELAIRGIVVSMSRRGNCWDNAPAESFFSTLKTELFAGESVPPTRSVARQRPRGGSGSAFQAAFTFATTVERASCGRSAAPGICGASFSLYLHGERVAIAVARLIGTPLTGGLSIDPLYHRPPMLIAQLTDDLPPATTLQSGDRVVTWEFLIRDILGTLGWRPDLLTRLEARRPSQSDGESPAS